MRIEVEVFGVVLRVTIGPEATEYEEFGYDRLNADVTHAGEQEDPVFPRLDWGDDEGRANANGVGFGRERKPNPAHSPRSRFGFEPQG